MPDVLNGITVIDVSQVAAVPMAARHLADFGANVIHVEHPVRGDSWRTFQQVGISDIPYLWENYNRNKRSLGIDISKRGGQQILYRLAKKADVFLTNLRLWEREKYNLSYTEIKKTNPRIVYGSLTGYGKKGPDKDNPAYDANSYWSRSGLQYLLTTPGLSPPAFRGAFGDNVSGLGLAFGIMLALYHRDRTGVGQEVDISLMQMGVYQMTFDMGGAVVAGSEFEQKMFRRLEETEEMVAERERLMKESKNAMSHLQEYYHKHAPNPIAVPYDTRDGRTISLVAAHADRNWLAVCRAIDRPDLIEDERFISIEQRKKHKVELYYILKEAFARRDLADWKDRLNSIPCSVVQKPSEVLEDQQAVANSFFTVTSHPTHGPITVIANPIILNETPAKMRIPAPEVGQHTEEILLEIGYNWEDISQLKDKGIIR